MNHFVTAFSGADNKSIDLGRVLWAAGFLFLCGMTVASWLRGQPWDIVIVSASLSGFCGAMAGSLRVKAVTEPPRTEPPA